MAAHFARRALQVQSGDEIAIVTVTEQLLADEDALHDIERQLSDLIVESSPLTLHLNLGHVKRLDAFCASRLVMLGREIKAGGRRLVLCGLMPSVQMMLESVSEDGAFQLRPATSCMSVQDDRLVPCHSRCAAASSDSMKLKPVVVLYDPRVDRAEIAAAKLAWELDEYRVIYATDEADLGRSCQAHPGAVVVLPLSCSASDGSDGPRSTEPPLPSVLGLLPMPVRPREVLLYGDVAHLSAAAYCRALDAGAGRILDERSPTFLSDLCNELLDLAKERSRDETRRGKLLADFAEHGLIGQSGVILQVFRRAVRVAQFSDLPVLLSGETGTGKQRLAEAIHRMDRRRREHPCVTVNCAAISSTLAESELFGHVKGSFSGAQSDHIGKFRAANGGTIVLDEIADLKRELQPKLLRVLQERRVSPVGADHEHPVDVRVIAITNRPLEQMVAAGLFRRDLFQRLNVFAIEIPPLRERQEDIEVQAIHFLQRFQPGSGPPVIGFSTPAMKALREFPWSGNSRELENAIRETLTNVRHHPLVEMEALPRWFIEMVAHQASASAPCAPSRGSRSESRRVLGVQKSIVSPLNQTLASQLTAVPGPGRVEQMLQDEFSLKAATERFQREFITAALKNNGGNRTRTAAALGISRQALAARLKKNRR